MSRITRDDVLKLARLSRLSLSEDELESFTKEINEIMSYVELLDAVDVDGLEPTFQVGGQQSVMREDEPIDYGYTNNDLLANAPAQQAHQFKVKRVL